MKGIPYKKLLLAGSLLALASNSGEEVFAQPSQSIVYVEGERYVVHNVKQGETLYSLSRMYGVDVEDIFESNPIIRNGLKAGANIKIPHIKAGESDQQVASSVADILDSEHARHIVVRGETLYSISRSYGIPISVLLEDNPQLEPAHISIGQTINIRKSQTGIAGKEQSSEDIAILNEIASQSAPKGMKYYTVKPEDRLRLLALQYNTSAEKIAQDNGLESVDDNALIVGSRIILPDAEPITLAPHENLIIEQSILFKALPENEILDIALLLPLTTKSRPMPQMGEFYKGFLLGIEDLKKEGYNIRLTLFNTKRDKYHLQSIINSEAYLEADLVVGPVFEDLFEDVLRDCEGRSIPLVSPLATLKKTDSPVLFQMAPTPENRMLGIREKITAEKTVTLIYSDNNDEEYFAAIKKMLEEQGVVYQTQYYAYEHPSRVSELKAIARRTLERAERDAAFDEIELDPWLVDSLKYRYSNSELLHLIANGAKHNTFFIMSDNETDVDRILSTIASTKANQLARNRGRRARITDRRMELRAPSPYNVIANPKWEDYKNIDRTLYFKDGVINFDSYYAGRELDVIRQFDARYAREFNEIPSPYSYRGYDVALIFGRGLYSDIEYGMEGRDFTPLANNYRFSRIIDDEGHTSEGHFNTHWMRVEYKPDYTINIKQENGNN